MSYYHRVISEKCPITTELFQKNVLLPQSYFRKNVRLPQLFQKNVLLPQLFQKNGCDLNVCNNIIIRDILYNADVINHIVKLIGHNPVGKLV